jgi:hypothetical protein
MNMILSRKIFVVICVVALANDLRAASSKGGYFVPETGQQREEARSAAVWIGGGLGVVFGPRIVEHLSGVPVDTTNDTAIVCGFVGGVAGYTAVAAGQAMQERYLNLSARNRLIATGTVFAASRVLPAVGVFRAARNGGFDSTCAGLITAGAGCELIQRSLEKADKQNFYGGF